VVIVAVGRAAGRDGSSEKETPGDKRKKERNKKEGRNRVYDVVPRLYAKAIHANPSSCVYPHLRETDF